MEIRANLSNEYSLYNALCYGGKKEKETSNYYPTEAELLNIFNNLIHRRILLDKLAPELKGSLLYHFLNQKQDISTSPFWQHTILHYKQPIHEIHSESDRWILSLETTLKALHQIRMLQKRILEIIDMEIPVNVLCLGAKAVVGLPELGRNLSIYCIESDESMLDELKTIYANEPGHRKLVNGDYQHYYPDRKHDVIIYPSGRTWQETEKMQDLLLKLRTYLKPEKGRVLAY